MPKTSRADSFWNTLTNSFHYKSVSSRLEPTERRKFEHEIDPSTSNLLEKAKAESQSHLLASADLGQIDTTKQQGRPWEVGIWARFPFLSMACLLTILASMAGLAAVLEISNGKNIETWDSRTVTIANHRRQWKVGVSTWISVFNFVMGQALAAMFAEAVAISWWVDALKGQTLDHLHFRWEVGTSFIKIILRFRFWGWICIASVAFTAFSGLETLLQTASSPILVLSQLQTEVTAIMANALPAGFSAVYATVAHDFNAPDYYTSPFVEILQNYSIQSPIYLDLDGCPSIANGWCTVTLPGIGFQYTCTATRGSVMWQTTHPSPNGSTIFDVHFAQEGWQITLNAAWKDAPEASDTALAQQICTLVPALVQYPVNVTSQGIVTLEPPTAFVNWTSNSTNTGNTTFHVDEVIHTLPMPGYDTAQENTDGAALPGTHSTLGGIGIALSSFFDSSIIAGWDPTNGWADITLQGSFCAPYAQFTYGTTNDYMMKNTIPSPIGELFKDIRDIMFRSTVAIVQNNITGYNFNSDPEGQDSRPPVENVTRPATYFVYETIYSTNHLILGLGIGLMLLAILAIMPLYWGFWDLGRKVTMSPLEVAKALHYSTRLNPETEALEVYSVLEARDRDDKPSTLGSNFSDDELVGLLGSTRVKYGEVAPNVLGIGMEVFTSAAKKGRSYH